MRLLLFILFTHLIRPANPSHPYRQPARGASIMQFEASFSTEASAVRLAD